jgi:hypothetical protein
MAMAQFDELLANHPTLGQIVAKFLPLTSEQPEVDYAHVELPPLADVTEKLGIGC